MTAVPAPDPAGRRWDRGSWAAALFALFIAGYTSLQLISAMRLPVDGWRVNIDSVAVDPQVVFQAQFHNTGASLQAEDVLVAVNGEPISAIVDAAHRQQYYQPRQPDWAPGTRLTYRVARAGQMLDVPVTLTTYDIREVLAASLKLEGTAGVIQLIASPFFFIVSLIAFLLRPRQPAAHALLHIGTAFLFQISPTVPTVPALFYGGLRYSRFVPWDYWMGAILPGLLYLVLTFPTPKWPLRVWPRLTIAAIYLGPTLAINLDYLAHMDDRVAFGQVALPIYAATALTVLVATLLSLAHSAVRLRDPVARSQLKWMTAGLLSFVVVGIGGWFAGYLGLRLELIQAIGTAGWFVFPVTLAIAILRYRLFDIDLIIRRTLVYAVLTALLALTYFGSIVVLQNIFSALTGQSQSTLVTVLSTLVIAALFGPLRVRVQVVIDRRLYRRKYDAARTLAAFGASVRDEVELAALTARLLGVVDETMQPASVGLWLRGPERRQP